MTRVELTTAQKQLLRSQVFDGTHPGTILADFEMFLDSVGTEGIPCVGRYNLLSTAKLAELDAKLCRPLNLQLDVRQVKAHPSLLGLQLIARATGMVMPEGKGARARLRLVPDLIEQWHQFNAVERYFTLLEGWLFVATAEMVGEQSHYHDSATEFFQLFPSFLFLPRELSTSKDTLTLVRLQEYQVHLFHLMGLVADPPNPKQERYQLTWHLRLTPFGKLFFLLLLGSSLFDEDEAPPGFGTFCDLFQPYFPDLKKSLVQKPQPTGPAGIYVCKVTLHNVWRKIALKSDTTLAGLMGAILKAFNFDFDHLYEISYRDSLGRVIKVGHDYMDDIIDASEITLADACLGPGQTIDVLYDFGDNWQFKVKLESIKPPGSLKGKFPRVLEKHGDAPQQYPNHE